MQEERTGLTDDEMSTTRGDASSNPAPKQDGDGDGTDARDGDGTDARDADGTDARDADGTAAGDST